MACPAGRIRYWLAEARDWIHAELASLGARAAGGIEQHSVQPWSTVLRVPTDLGVVYFKANGSVQRHEAALVTVLAEQDLTAFRPCSHATWSGVGC